MSGMATRLPAELKILHEGFLATGVQGWGDARQYATVCETHPDRVTNFLRITDQEQQRQQRRRDAELREELEQRLVEDERRRSARLLAARRYEKEQRQVRWRHRQHGLVAAARVVFGQEERRKQTQREQRRRRRELRERTKTLQGQKQQQRRAEENVPQGVDHERGDSAATSTLTPPPRLMSTAVGPRSAAPAATSTTAAAPASPKSPAPPFTLSSPTEGQQCGGEPGPAPVLSVRHLSSRNLATNLFSASAAAAAPASPEAGNDIDIEANDVTVADTAVAEVDATPPGMMSSATKWRYEWRDQRQQQLLWNLYRQRQQQRREQQRLQQQEQLGQHQQQPQQQCELFQQEGKSADVDEQLAQQEIAAMRAWEAAAAVAEEVAAAAAAAAGATPAGMIWEDFGASDHDDDAMALGCAQDKRELQEEEQLPKVGCDLQEDPTEAAAVSRQWEKCQPGAMTVPDEYDAGDVEVGEGASDGAGPPLPEKRKATSLSSLGESAATLRDSAYDPCRGGSEQSFLEPPDELAPGFEGSHGYILPIAEVLEITINAPLDVEEPCAESNWGGAGNQALLDHDGSPSSVAAGSIEDKEEKEKEERARSRATCPALTATSTMFRVTPVGRGGSAGMMRDPCVEENKVERTGEDKITGASWQSPHPTNPSGRGEGETGGERNGTVRRKMSDRHRALLFEELIDWRQHRAKSIGARFAPVLLPDAEIEEVVDKVPTTTDELRTVGTWRGSRKLAKHGGSLISAIQTFLAVNKIPPGKEFPCREQGAKAREEGMNRSPHGLPRRYRTRASLDDSFSATDQTK